MWWTLVAARLLAAAVSPIPDCDEVFNFWEPTHFVTHGSGLQTWEWSPVYAIRSWAYVWVHALLIKGAQLVGLHDKQLFYFLRVVFALFESFVELQLARALRKYDKMAANMFLIFTTCATGLMHASVSYLPSSFAMYFVTLADAYFLANPQGIVKSLLCIAVAGLVGWPFVLVLALPLGVYYTTTVKSLQQWSASVVKCLIGAGAILAVVVAVDSLLYKKLVVVPFNIVAYNVLYSDSETGPDIFGTEPWNYYVFNLVLNFNFMFPMALMSCVYSRGPVLAVISQIYLWLGILFNTPHKEERFIYPIYPIVCLAASYTLAKMWKLFNAYNRVPKIMYQAPIAAVVVVSVLRSLALAQYYNGPLQVYDGLAENSTVCLGREWYRYPSSYFLNESSRARFIKSGFDGLLPGVFESYTAIPPGMNNKNLFDPGKLVDIDQCDYIIELDVPVNSGAGEFQPANDPEWQVDSCSKFLDVQNTPTLGRLLYGAGATYVDYCRYRRKA